MKRNYQPKQVCSCQIGPSTLCIDPVTIDRSQGRCKNDVLGLQPKGSWSLLMKVSRFACQWAIHAPSQPLSTPKTGSWKASACKTKTLNALKTASLFFFTREMGRKGLGKDTSFPWKDQHIYGSWGFTANRRAPAFRLRISWSVTAKRIWGNRQQKQDQKAESKTILISNVQCYSSGKWPFKKSKVVKNCHQTFATYAKESLWKIQCIFWLLLKRSLCMPKVIANQTG